ncbi:axonemal dynein light chain domain-containing protein 1 isoform X2 [Tachyglossus aculeatus]|uniref:axonemal dynein light chain domain-containing protein 1 isoform X2 n=1 Tax=Tachyglossus aculeatus TaxID=9261 RepID=UPI0018F5F90A|nr:axonemal dynein light chain domain-containing protein 1 isoform X2 [Tachyglossus aculeatus]
MSFNKAPRALPPPVPTPENQKWKFLTSTKEKTELPELREKSSALDRSKPLPTTLQHDFIPEEILISLTSTANAATCPESLRPPKKVKSIKELKDGLRTANPIWHHPTRRDKFRFLTDHPISLRGAGRDVSFLYDVKNKKLENLELAERPSSASVSESHKAKKLIDTLIPEEFHIVSNTGVTGLQYYDDKYTTLLEDSENRLLLFPSMKPNKRIEVIQLKDVMDTLLQKAGVDGQKSVGPTKLHDALQILKTEQNIYNTVFHELIRQITVECADRGALLSNLRQRYVQLIERVSHQMVDMYKDMMVQGVMDRHIVEELYNFKNAIEALTRELHLVREHDAKVTKDAELAHRELAQALVDSEKNADLVEDYRGLYELQRRRMEAVISQLTLERSIWSSTTYDLALKVIERNKLMMAKRLFLSEKAWTEHVEYFIVMLASKDASDLEELQQLTMNWRKTLGHFRLAVEENEERTREKLRLIKTGLSKWLQYFQENSVKEQLISLKENISNNILEDFKTWENMLSEDTQQFGGDQLLEKLETLKVANNLQKKWTDVGLSMLLRHKSLDGEMPPELQLMEDINLNTTKLCEEYDLRVSGENGLAKIFPSLNNCLETWVLKMEAGQQRTRMSHADWVSLYQNLPEMLSQLNELLVTVGSAQKFADRNKEVPHVPVVQANVFNMIQQWILTMTSGTEKDNIELHQQVTELHTTMVHWMVNLLIIIVPNHIEKDSLPKTELDISEEKESYDVGISKLELEAIDLAKSLSKFSNYMMSCCNDMVTTLTLKEIALTDSDYYLKELKKIKVECLNWINTCNLLLSEIKGRGVTLLSPEELENLLGQELSPEETQCQNESTDASEEFSYDLVDIRGQSFMDKKSEGEGESVAEDTSPPDSRRESRKMTKEEFIRYVGPDLNVHSKPLMGEQVPVTGKGMVASIASTRQDKNKFDVLTVIEHLQMKLLPADAAGGKT